MCSWRPSIRPSSPARPGWTPPCPWGSTWRPGRWYWVYGDCYSYCLLALGHIDLVIEGGLQAYDIQPLIPIIEAAGGVVTGRHGEDASDGGFVVAAANRELHAAALRELESTPLGGTAPP